jgi:hypothetical protein
MTVNQPSSEPITFTVTNAATWKTDLHSSSQLLKIRGESLYISYMKHARNWSRWENLGVGRSVIELESQRLRSLVKS